MRGHFQFLSGYDAANTHIWALVVVGRKPQRVVNLGLFDRFDEVSVQQFESDGAVKSLEVRVLLVQSWLDALDGDAPFLSPYQQ